MEKYSDFDFKELIKTPKFWLCILGFILAIGLSYVRTYTAKDISNLHQEAKEEAIELGENIINGVGYDPSTEDIKETIKNEVEVNASEEEKEQINEIIDKF